MAIEIVSNSESVGKRKSIEACPSNQNAAFVYDSFANKVGNFGHFAREKKENHTKEIQKLERKRRRHEEW